MQKFFIRKKVNFMIDKEILIKIEKLLPAGKRSDFINVVLEEALTQYGRGLASDNMNELAKKSHFKISTNEIIKLKDYGRS